MPESPAKGGRNVKGILSYDIENARDISLAFVGRGPALDALVAVLSRTDLSSAFPRMKITGWVPDPGQAPGDGSDFPILLRSIPVFADIPELFSPGSDIVLAIDMTPDARHMARLRAEAGPRASLLSAEMLLRFCAAVDAGRLSPASGDRLRKTQKLFGLLVDQIEGDVFILDDTSRILDVNHYAASSRGMTTAQIIGMTCGELHATTVSPCRGDEDKCPFHVAKATGKKAAHTFTQVQPDGRARYFEAICYPVTDVFQSPVVFLYIQRDVTERQYMEQRLQQTEKMALLGELSTYMAHEIRNPLFSIGGFANALLRNTSLNDLAREKARIIYEESRRLDIILTSILNFARPTEQAMGVFNVEDEIRRAVDLMTMGSEERGITTVEDIAPNLPKARGNAVNLRQCLINVLKNALEAMPDGGTLTLRARHSHNYVDIEVEDTGQAIPLEIQDSIFSPFFSARYEGMGRGLAMTRKVVEDMGGRVTFESAPGRSNKVRLQIPVALACDEAEAEA